MSKKTIGIILYTIGVIAFIIRVPFRESDGPLLNLEFVLITLFTKQLLEYTW